MLLHQLCLHDTLIRMRIFESFSVLTFCGISRPFWRFILEMFLISFTITKKVRKRPTKPGVLLLSLQPFTPAEMALGGLRADFAQVDRIGAGTIGTIHKWYPHFLWFLTDSPFCMHFTQPKSIYHLHNQAIFWHLFPFPPPLPVKVNFINDCLIGSGTDSLAAWHSAYYAMVEQYRMDGRFLGKEQSVMASVCLKSPELCFLVRLPPGPVRPDDWFALQEWLRGEGTLGNYWYDAHVVKI